MEKVLITNGIRVATQVEFMREENTKTGPYYYSYNITILNKNKFDVQLINRQWMIHDFNPIVMESKVVQGKGVVGQQPLLKPGESFSYTSHSIIKGTMGFMYGTYMMRRTSDEEYFQVNIPDLLLIHPALYN